MASPRSFIVTGGAGFIGANLVAELLRREPTAHVVILDHPTSGSFLNVVTACDRAGVSPFAGGFLNDWVSFVEWPELLRRVVPAAVFHLAALTDTTVSDECRMMDANVGGFNDRPDSLLPSCHAAGIPLVYASSAATYGTPPQTGARQPFPLSAAGRPSNIYGFSKWIMECEHRRFALANPGARVVGLRYFNVFGPGEASKGHMASMVYQLAAKMLRYESPRLFRDGTQARDQIHVDDVVSCTLAASGLWSDTPPTPGVYNLGSGIATSFNEIVEALRVGLDIPSSRLPTEYFDMPPAIRTFYQDFTQADMSDTSKGLAWSPSILPREGIISYAHWLKTLPGLKSLAG